MTKFLVPLLVGTLLTGPTMPAPVPLQNPSALPGDSPDDNAWRINETLAGLKKTERAMYLFERIERVEKRDDPHDQQPASVKVSLVFPAGTGIAHIPLGLDEKPGDPKTYRADLDKLLKSLEWAAQTGKDQTKAYDKVEKKLKERDELIDATRSAFIFTLVGPELRAGRPLLKFRMEPNPAFKPSNRNTSFFAKVKGYVWIDEATSQLARVEGEIVEDISFGIFLGKIYKGSHFMQERYPEASGVWLPSFSQYDFDGRKFFSSISIHEKTFYKDYRRVGPPREALPILRAEIARLGSPVRTYVGADP
jgi:hypothetical protein